MTKDFLGLLVFFISSLSFSQIQGTVTDKNKQPLPFVNILIENTYKGTTTNDDGFYELSSVNKTGSYTLVFTYLGYKTEKRTITILKFPYDLDVVLEEESLSLDEVLISSEENLANVIIRQTIANRKSNLEKYDDYKADFYSRGLIRIKDAPEKILGQDIGDLGGGLDSTRSGIIYLSETISKIQFLRPRPLKEKITASKVSGDDNGFSFNNAIDVDYNFYNNLVTFGGENISPIANNAFSYYTYRLEGVFYDERGNLINKIKVTPKRENDPVFSGFLYIVEDQWTLYALELNITGIQARIPPADIISLKQNYSFSERDQLWSLRSQSIDFKYAIFGIKGDGRFTAVYSNYEFNAGLSNKDFNRELVAFAPEANKKDSLFWNELRPVPLTEEELTDYIKKDSIQIVKSSKSYLDSIDRVNNQFKLANILGYTYQNSSKNYSLGFDIPIGGVQFNTVQGYTVETDVFFTKNLDEFREYFRASANIQYGFSDDRLRATGNLTYKFNDISNRFLTLSGGILAKQFSPSNPITPFGNTLATLFFQENYMKLYDHSYLQLGYSEEILNGISIFANVSYERRTNLFNSTDQTFYPREGKLYLSNNPLDPINDTSSFVNHNIVKLNVNARINFGQNYLSYPKSKFNITNEAYPTLVLGYEKGIGATVSNYNFDQIKARIYQSFSIADKGEFGYNLRIGKFFNAEDIAFMDFQHFNGNQINVSRRGNYTNVFNNLAYYDFSTNDSYFEFHAEHDFNGFVLGKIPGLNKLNFNLILGVHQLSTADIKPYREFTIGLDNIGWGKWRFLRFDYIRSYQSGFVSDAIVFGLKIF